MKEKINKTRARIYPGHYIILGPASFLLVAYLPVNVLGPLVFPANVQDPLVGIYYGFYAGYLFLLISTAAAFTLMTLKIFRELFLRPPYSIFQTLDRQRVETEDIEQISRRSFFPLILGYIVAFWTPALGWVPFTQGIMTIENFDYINLPSKLDFITKLPLISDMVFLADYLDVPNTTGYVILLFSTSLMFVGLWNAFYLFHFQSEIFDKQKDRLLLIQRLLKYIPRAGLASLIIIVTVKAIQIPL